MTTTLSPQVDLISDSLDHLLALSFAKSSSPSYFLAVNVTKSAAKYQEMRIGRTLVHLAAFAKTQEQAAWALTVIKYVGTWKATQVFTAGRLVEWPWRAVAVIECFLEASSCNDRTAHCHKVIMDPYRTLGEVRLPMSISIDLNGDRKLRSELVDHYRFPCRYLLEHGRFRFQTSHPATPEDQIQAAAVKTGCAWCPCFDAGEYGKIGTAIETRVG